MCSEQQATTPYNCVTFLAPKKLANCTEKETLKLKAMFAKLKKKIAEEAATAPRSSVRIPRTISKESITSVGADSGDDFVS